jgi:hypothetical protein
MSFAAPHLVEIHLADRHLVDTIKKWQVDQLTILLSTVHYVNWRCCRWNKCLSVKSLSAKFLLAKCLLAKCLLGKCQLAKCLSAKFWSTKRYGTITTSLTLPNLNIGNGYSPVGSGVTPFPHHPPPSLSITEPSFTSHVVPPAPAGGGASTPGIHPKELICSFIALSRYVSDKEH